MSWTRYSMRQREWNPAVDRAGPVMSLWMDEVRVRESVVAAIPETARLELAHRAMQWSLEAARPGVDRWIQPETLAFLDRVLADHARTRPADDAALESLGDETAVLEEKDAPTGAALISAAWTYVARDTDGLDVPDTMSVLLSCYEAVLHTRQLGRTISTEMERNDPECARAIRVQLEMIDAAPGRA